MADILKAMSKEDTYSLLGVMLYASSKNPNYTLLSELAFLLDNQSFANFLKYFEGQTITIPTWGEIDKALKVLMLHHYYRIEKLPYDKALEMSGFAEDEGKRAVKLLNHFEKQLEGQNYRSGGIKNVIKAD